MPGEHRSKELHGTSKETMNALAAGDDCTNQRRPAKRRRQVLR
jgi:hypothetical protein